MERVLSQFENVVSVPTGTPGAQAWTAREPSSGRQVLVKRLPGDAGKARATLALALRQPRIVPTRRWLRDGDGFYVVRDWVPGANLRTTLADTSLRAFDRLHARLLPLLDALDSAHAAGLTHGALTPENVLVDSRVPGSALLSDFATVPLPPSAPPREDLAGLCRLYQEFLPTRPGDDEAGQAARTRLLRNLAETQQTAQSSEELRYKLDAIARMADLLGFGSQSEGQPPPSAVRVPRLVCAVSPPSPLVAPGGGTSLTLLLDNEGDAPLHIESVSSDVVWLNLPTRFVPVDLDPGTGGDLIWNISGARLDPGTYQAALTVRSNTGLDTGAPRGSAALPETVVTVPVLVRGLPAEDSAEAIPPPPENVPQNVPLAESLPHAEFPGIACVQDPDPVVVAQGGGGVLRVGLQNIGPQRLRVDKVRVRPAWLSYPGAFQPLWIEPGQTQYLGFQVSAAGLVGGDYQAEVTWTTTVMADSMTGPRPVWREMPCQVRVRVVRPAGDALPGGAASRAGCATFVLTLLSALAVCLGVWLKG